MPVRIDADLCIGCSACTGVCPTNSLSMNADGKSEVDESSCVDCSTCIATCPVEAISE